MANRAELAAFLRARHARLSPREAGLPEVGRRRSPADVIWSDERFLRFTRSTVADLRAGYARYPGDPEIESLVSEMLALSPRFAEMWASYEVEVRGPMLKSVVHPDAGPLEFECQVLHIAETGQRIIAYCAAPGSPAEAAFRVLAAGAALA